MQSSARNSRQRKWRRPAVLRALLLLCVLAAVYRRELRVFADTDGVLREPSRKLAERVAAIPGLHGPLRLEWYPDETWSEGRATRWQDMLRDEFDRRALEISEETSAPALSVYATETPTQIVLTAKAQVGDRAEVRIVTILRASLPPAESPVAPVRVERQLIYQSPDRILDASSLASGPDGGLAVLQYKNFEAIAFRVDAKGELRQVVSLNAAAVKPVRDPHGEISPHGNQVSVQLWGKTCDFSWDSPAEVKCHPEKVLSPVKAIVRMDAVLTSPCDRTNWTVLQRSIEPTMREVLHLVPDGSTQESSTTVMSEFPGPVLNLSVEQSPGNALVVTRNLRTGNYEVYKITLACGN